MDNEVNDVPEDGEIIDYEPLPRPSVASVVSKCSFRSNNERGRSSDSSENSDSDSGRESRKRPKILKRSSARNKYNVWTSEVQASELMDEICNWEAGINNKVMDKSRAVESYYHFAENEEPKHSTESDNRKRHHGEVVDLRSKLGRKPSPDKDQTIHPRYLSELKVSLDDSVEDVTRDITLKLCEENEDLVLRVVTVLGTEKAIDLFNKTRNLEENGGMMVMNGSRRRTPGGVFLQLIKKDISVSKQQKNSIFIDDQKVGNKSKKSKAKSHQKKESEINTTLPADNVETECLTVLQNRKDLVVSKETHVSEGAMVMDNSEPQSTIGNDVDPRQMAVYDDIFDDNPCDVEFT
ncbi:hypothetical protein R5R35_005597 [Gryllus longicercus]|uniref:Phosphorylated adapter RNA export protein n=1 Tax=Gryllus longicercus TaxID=2509291 RepID=A0AAN9V7W2_9ORTH